MLKTYILEDNTTFKTITLPKGTILIRGIDFTKYNPDEYVSEFFHYSSCIPPTKHVYLYPVPYAGIAVNNFNVYIFYTTNYDIELLLLVKPSQQFKSDMHDHDKSLNTIMKLCNHISPKDLCGYKMSEYDPCFTPYFIKHFPHILGYIGIDAADVELFENHYSALLRHGQVNKIKQILPSIIQNSRGFTGVPEIVIHPLHLRRQREIKFKYEYRLANKRMEWILKSRARYNYTPLLYITDKNTFTANDLTDYTNVEKLMNGTHFDYSVNNILFDNIENVLYKFLHDGYIVDGYKYNFHIDKYTGFYKLYSTMTSRANIKVTLKNKNDIIMNANNEDFHDTIYTPIVYKSKTNLSDSTIQNMKMYYDIDTKEKNINRHLYSFSNSLIFDKGNYKTQYKVEDVFSRPDIRKPVFTKRRFTRRKRNMPKMNIGG